MTKYCLQARFYSCATAIHCPIAGMSGECTPADQRKLATFFPCAEKKVAGGLSSFANAVPCANEAGLDTAAIIKCYDHRCLVRLHTGEGD